MLLLNISTQIDIVEVRFPSTFSVLTRKITNTMPYLAIRVIYIQTKYKMYFIRMPFIFVQNPMISFINSYPKVHISINSLGVLLLLLTGYKF